MRRLSCASAALLGLSLLVAAPAPAAIQRGAEERAAEGGERPPRISISPATAATSRAAGATASPPPVISLSVRDADLVEVVRSLARIAGVNLIVDPGVGGKVTAELVDVRWDRALAVILKSQGLGMELDGRVLTVATPSRLARP